MPKPLEYTFAILGSMAVQGPVMSWVADHRKHHAHADEEGDPHSPHVGHGDGIGGVLRGLWHAHTGWLFSTQGRASARQYAKDLYEDRGMRRGHREDRVIVRRRDREIRTTGNVGCRTTIVKKEDRFGRMTTKRIQTCE